MSQPQASAPPLFMRASLIGLLLVGVLGFAALLSLFAFAPDMRGRADSGAHALSPSAIGYAGLARLLRSERQSVLISRGDDADARAQASLIILTPGAPMDEEAWREQITDRPTLIVLPKWIGAPDPTRAGWARNAGIITEDQIAAIAAPVDQIVVERREIRARPLLSSAPRAPVAAEPMRLGATDSFQTFASRDLIPWIVDDQDRVLLAAATDRPLFVLSDPDILNTHGLSDYENARTAMAIIAMVRGGDGPIIFDVSLNGFARTRNPLRLALEPPFLAATLCLVAAALLAGWQAIIRFGAPTRPERAFAYGKQALADNSAGLIRLAGAEHKMGESYARAVRDMAARAVGAPRTLRDEQLTTYLDRVGRHANAETSLSTLTDLARIASDRYRLLRIAQALFNWRVGVTRAGR